MTSSTLALSFANSTVSTNNPSPNIYSTANLLFGASSNNSNNSNLAPISVSQSAIVSPTDTATSSSSCSPNNQTMLGDAALNLSNASKVIGSLDSAPAMVNQEHLQNAWLNLQQRAWEQIAQQQSQCSPNEEPTKPTTELRNEANIVDETENDDKPTLIAETAEGEPSEEIGEPSETKTETPTETEPELNNSNSEAADLSMRSTSELSMGPPETSSSPKSRRKSYHPQQIQNPSTTTIVDPAVSPVVGATADDIDAAEPAAKRVRSSSPPQVSPNGQPISDDAGSTQAQRFQEVIQMQRQFYLDLVQQQQRKLLETQVPTSNNNSGNSNNNTHNHITASINNTVNNMSNNNHNTSNNNNNSSRQNNPDSDKLTQSSQKFHDQTGKEIKSLGDNMKTELMTSLTATVDRLLSDFARDYQARATLALQEHLKLMQRTNPAAAAAALNAFNGLTRPTAPFYPPFLYGNNAFPYASLAAQQQALSNGLINSIFPSSMASTTTSSTNQNYSQSSLSTSCTPTNKEQAGSPFARKKRSKVTDTRLSKMPVRSDSAMAVGDLAPLSGSINGSSPKPTSGSANLSNYFPPTMVGLFGNAGGNGTLGGFGSLSTGNNQSLTQSLSQSLLGNQSINSDDPLGMDTMTPDGLDDGSEMNYSLIDASMKNNTQLSAMHLRKAKLMFFYTRYPSSSLLKTYFPDVQFNKNNTAQLVKWFSNFREFYYIQMEKFARQALDQGLRRPDELIVTTDCELYKVLVQHYNRNQHLQVPSAFRDVVEATLREFFLSIQAGKDAEPSWKKQIYKVIARLDDSIPEYFKNPKFLEQLE